MDQEKFDFDLTAVENRPELKAARKMASIKKQEYKMTRREYFPTANAFGSYDWDSDDFNDFQESYMVGVTIVKLLNRCL